MEIKLDRKKDYITKSDHKEQIMKYLSWKIKPFALYHEIRGFIFLGKDRYFLANNLFMLCKFTMDAIQLIFFLFLSCLLSFFIQNNKPTPNFSYKSSTKIEKKSVV